MGKATPREIAETSFRLLFVFMCFSVITVNSSFADYLVVKRAATIRANPSASAEVVARAELGTYLSLTAENTQKSGYYQILDPETGERGWIYRTLVRRFPGELHTIYDPLGSPGRNQGNPPKSFERAKSVAVKLWWDIGARSFYCDCPYRPATKNERRLRPGNLWVGGPNCSYKPFSPLTRNGKVNAKTSRIEWEHIVPADWIATAFHCQEGSRSECKAIDGFKKAEGDLFNLVPAIGELNNDRSARLFGVVENESREYGACDFKVDNTGPGEPHVRGLAEPAKSIQGDIARIWLYMERRYGIKIPPKNRKTLLKWMKNDPVDKRELHRHNLISEKMGWENPFVVD